MKELAISLVIIVGIFIGNNITQNYTQSSVQETSNDLFLLKEDIKSNNNKEDLQNKVNDIYDNWHQKHQKLAYYIEHDELEKVETNLTLLKSYIEMEEETESVAKVEETVYILRHIEAKNKFNLENIF